MISALKKQGLDKLLEVITAELEPTRKRAELLIPYSAGDVAAKFRKDGVVEEEEYRADGLYLKLIADIYMLDKFKEYIIT